MTIAITYDACGEKIITGLSPWSATWYVAKAGKCGQYVKDHSNKIENDDNWLMTLITSTHNKQQT